MATETSLTEKRVNPAGPVAVAIAAWIVPGLGHLLLRRWARALGFFVAAGGLALAGYALRGEVFTSRSSDTFGALGFLADLGSGVFYLLSRYLEIGGSDISLAVGDYGTRFIAAAGIVNLLAVVDACGIALRRRN